MAKRPEGVDRTWRMGEDGEPVAAEAAKAEPLAAADARQAGGDGASRALGPEADGAAIAPKDTDRSCSQADVDSSYEDPLRGWTVVVEGVDGHVSFISAPRPRVIRALDLVPPRPSKLMRILELAVHVADTDGEPVVFMPLVLDINELTAKRLAGRGGGASSTGREDGEENIVSGDAVPSSGDAVPSSGDAVPSSGDGTPPSREGPACVMFPCEASGLGTDRDHCGPGGTVRFLDKTPDMDDGGGDATLLVGCDTSAMIYRSLYGGRPELLDICPRVLIQGFPEIRDGPSIIRCCKMFDRYGRDGDVILLPWGPTVKMAAAAMETLIHGAPVDPRGEDPALRRRRRRAEG